jgi:hypothetical protein
VCGLAALAAGTAAASMCDSPTFTITFDPQLATAIENGGQWCATACFDSPENDDPTLVLHLGDPDSQDGCIGGMLSGSPDAVGKLRMVLGELLCVKFDVSSAAPYRVEVLDAGQTLVYSATLTSATFEWEASFGTLHGWRIVLTPGENYPGYRDPLCIDDLRYVYVGVPVRSTTWGAVKSIYR